MWLYYLYYLYYPLHPSYSWHITDTTYCLRCLHLIDYWKEFQNAQSIVSGTELCNYFLIVRLEATVSSDVGPLPFCLGLRFSLLLFSVCLCLFRCVCPVQVSGLPILHLPTRCPLSVALLYTSAAHLLHQPLCSGHLLSQLAVISLLHI